MVDFRRIYLYSLIFFSGFANLAIEVIGPRLFASLFGYTTTVWATIISVTLVGISLGYASGGRVQREKIGNIFPLLLLLNALWLLFSGWFVLRLPAVMHNSNSPVSLFLTALSAFFVPSFCFGMVSPLAITLLTQDRFLQGNSTTVGNVLGIGTLGSVLGALTAAYFFIPWVGLTNSLRLFALGLVLFALIFSWKRGWFIVPLLLVFVAIFPLPAYTWESDLILLTQVEGYYETIRVFTDGETFVRMNVGTSYDTEMDLQTRLPRFQYAQRMVELAGDVSAKEILIIGGAGHTQARAFEMNAATVTEVEIDPVVVRLSDEYFGAIKSEVNISDGRAFLEAAYPTSYDLILVDAFGPQSIPPQLTTREFFVALARALKPGGRMIYNFIGAASGPDSDAFHALSRTVSSVFTDARVSAINGYQIQNLLLLGSMSEMPDVNFPPAPRHGFLLTDEKNPLDIFMLELLEL